MQTRAIDALQLWWRELNYTNNQRRALGAIAIFALALSALFIFHPHKAVATKSVITPAIVAPPMLIVDVSGEVLKPGVYELVPNSRVNDAIKAAGGPSKSADLSSINLARVIKDGEQIYVDRKSAPNTVRRNSSSSSSNGLININRANAKELEKLPGIGPVLASRIIEYRKANGAFGSIDELKKIPGIGGSKLEKFREKIRV